MLDTQFWMSSDSGSLGPSQGRGVGRADSRSDEDLNLPLSLYQLPLALDVQFTHETSQAWTVNLTPLPNEDPKPPAKMGMSLDLTML